MAVRREDNLVRTRNVFNQILENRAIFLWEGIANSIRDVDGGCARLDGNFNRTTQKVTLGAGCIFGRPFNLGN